MVANVAQRVRYKFAVTVHCYNAQLGKIVAYKGRRRWLMRPVSDVVGRRHLRSVVIRQLVVSRVLRNILVLSLLQLQ